MITVKLFHSDLLPSSSIIVMIRIWDIKKQTKHINCDDSVKYGFIGSNW